MHKRVNLASLPREEMLSAARDSARSVFADEDVISAIVLDLRTAWINKNLPRACGQTDEEFGVLVDLACEEFDAGIDEAIAAAKASATPPAAPRAVDKDRLLGSVHELTAMIWGVIGVCQEEAEPKYTGAYVQRMSELAYEIEKAIDVRDGAREQNG